MMLLSKRHIFPFVPLLKGQAGKVSLLRRPCLPLSAVTVSLHYLPRYLPSTVTCGKTSVATLLLRKSTRFHDKKH